MPSSSASPCTSYNLTPKAKSHPERTQWRWKKAHRTLWPTFKRRRYLVMKTTVDDRTCVFDGVVSKAMESFGSRSSSGPSHLWYLGHSLNFDNPVNPLVQFRFYLLTAKWCHIPPCWSLDFQFQTLDVILPLRALLAQTPVWGPLIRVSCNHNRLKTNRLCHRDSRIVELHLKR